MWKVFWYLIVNLFKCKHKAVFLHLDSETTRKPYDEHHDIITCTLYCVSCNKYIKKSSLVFKQSIEDKLFQDR